MKTNKFEELIESAAEYAPDTAAAELGFETRLMARIRELRDNGNGSLFEVVASWSWRSAFGLTPVVLAALVFFFVAHGASLSLPAGTQEFVGYLAGWLPSDLF